MPAAERYRAHLAERVFPSLRRLPGHRDAYLLLRAVDDGVDVLVVTVWESRAAIAAFAGEDLERAVVEPEVVELLDRRDARVRHFDVALRAH